MRHIILLIIINLISAVCFAATPLLPDKAFKLNIEAKSDKEIIAEWQIAPGYYLYRDQLKIKLVPAHQEKISQINWPQGVLKTDPVHGKKVEVYTGTLTIPIMMQNVFYHDQLQFQIHYQGCSKKGFCYPPTKKILSLSVNSVGEPPVFNPNVLQNQNSATTFLEKNSLLLNLALFLGLGLLLAFTPCVLPMVPILSGIIVGQGAKLNTKKAFLLSLTYVLGSSLAYMFAGLLVAWLGSSVQAALQKPWVIFSFSGLFFLLALSLFDVYQIRAPARFQNFAHELNQRQSGGTYLGVFFMGAFSTLIVSPCVSAPLVGVLAYISQTGNLLLGGAALFALGLGMGIPLLLLGVSAGKWLPKGGPWMDMIKKLWGILMLAMAIWLMSRVISVSWTLLLAALLLILTAVVLFFFSPIRTLWPKISRITGSLIGAYGLLLFVGVTQGTADPVHPWRTGAQLALREKPAFTVVHNVSQLRQELRMAQKAGKPVLLDYYADWCDSCVMMDKNVFEQPKVKNAMRGLVLLRADITNNDKNDEALMRRYRVIAPPTILFFDTRGREISSQRIVGEVSASDFLMRLKQAY